MRVNSNAAEIETPEKNPIDLSEQPHEAIASNLFGRQSPPSKHLVDLLESAKRQHIFHHDVVHIVPLENMKLTLKLRNKVRKLFEEYEDVVSERLLEFERFEIDKQNFSTIVMDFISYEFKVIKEHSFSVVVLLNYLKMFDLEPEVAFGELFNFSVNDTVCAKCYSVKGVANVKDICNINLKFLKSVIVNEFNCGEEDSDDDPDYEEKKLDSEEEEETEIFSKNHGNLNHIVENVDCYEEIVEGETAASSSKIEESVAEDHVTNPFVDSDDDVIADVYDFNEVSSPNGTNPFETSSDDDDSELKNYGRNLGPRSSSVKRTCQHLCDHCQKIFQTKYNLKLHLISQHRQGSQSSILFLNEF